MPAIGEQSDKLHALGRVLDMRAARDMQIVNHEAFICLSWTNTAGKSSCLSYQERELDHLLVQMRSARNQPRGADGSYAALLQTLGQDLDLNGVEASAIVEEQYGFRVTGLGNGKYFNQLFPADNLWAQIARRQPAPTDRALTERVPNDDETDTFEPAAVCQPRRSAFSLPFSRALGAALAR